MREWLLSASLALLALALFWLLLFPKVGGPEEPVAKPLSTEAGPPGYRALDLWLNAEHVPVVHWHGRYSDLRAGPANSIADGDVLITTMPHSAPVRQAELEKLDQWVSRGNTLVVLAALDDSPRWAESAYGMNFQGQLSRVLRLKLSLIFGKADDEDEDEDDKAAGADGKASSIDAGKCVNPATDAGAAETPVPPPAPAGNTVTFVPPDRAKLPPDSSTAAAPSAAAAKAPEKAAGDPGAKKPRAATTVTLPVVEEPKSVDVTLEPIRTAAGTHALFEGVGTVSVYSERPGTRWRVAPMDSSPLLELARRADTGDAAVWLKPYGRGTILFSAFASPFSNERLGLAGNARWLGNILALSLGPHGRVLIDDAHQGVADYYDPTAFYADPRLHHAIGWIVLVWFVYVVCAPHLRAATGGRAPIDDVAMLNVTARFYAGALAAPAAGTQLIEQFFNGIRRRRALSEDGTPAWDWLEAHARVSGEDVRELRAFDERLADGHAVDLNRLQNLLSTLSGHIA